MKKFFLYLAFALSAAAVHAQQYTDSLRVLCIGNSFTFVADAHLKLHDLALSQGHYMDVNAQLQGGFTLQRHIIRDATMSALINGNFDHVFLQDQSQTPALYGEYPGRCRLVAEDAAELAERVRIYSPNAHIWMEQTWSYSFSNYGGFGSYEHFDDMLRKGSKAMAELMHADVSPIGEAFIICRAEHPEINLYDKDDKHQSAYGSYLKACVNYLLIYGAPFTAKAANCDLDGKACAELRKIAERVVLK